MKKVLWIDTETTGLKPDKHGLIQIAYIYEEDNVIKEKGNIKSSIMQGDMIDDEALEVNGLDPKDLITFPDAKEAFNSFLLVLEKYVDKRNYRDKIMLAGYNTSFDIEFLKKWFEKNNNYDFKKYFHRKFYDVMQVGIGLSINGLIDVKDNKLVTMCERMGIELNPHDAMNDIIATYELNDVLFNFRCKRRN